MGASILEHFATLEDPRIERGKEHQLLDIVVLAICAVVCGAEGWEAIELFGRTKLEWLRRYVPLANGIPAHARDGLEQACEATRNEGRLG